MVSTALQSTQHLNEMKRKRVKVGGQFKKVRLFNKFKISVTDKNEAEQLKERNAGSGRKEKEKEEEEEEKTQDGTQMDMQEQTMRDESRAQKQQRADPLHRFIGMYGSRVQSVWFVCVCVCVCGIPYTCIVYYFAQSH